MVNITFILLGILGAQEIIFIAVIVLVLFGDKKISELMKQLGKGVKEYNKTIHGVKEQFNKIKDDNIDSDVSKKEK